MLYLQSFQTNHPVFDDEYKQYVCQTVDNFISNPTTETIMAFSNLFNLLKFSFDSDYCKLEDIDTSSFETIEKDIEKYYLASTYGKFLSDYLSTKPLENISYPHSEHFNVLPISTKLSQIIHTPILFNHLKEIKTQLDVGNYYTKPGVNSSFFYNVLKHSFISSEKKLSEYVDHEYPYLDYNNHQNIFLSSFASQETIVEAFNNLLHNPKEMFQNSLKKAILCCDNGEGQQIIDSIDLFLKKISFEIQHIKKLDLPEKIEISKIIKVIKQHAMEIKPLCTTEDRQMYQALWAFHIRREKITYKREFFQQYLDSEKVSSNLELMLINFMSEQNNSYFKISEYTSHISLRKKIKSLDNILSLDAFLYTVVYNTKLNQVKEEKRVLHSGLTDLPIAINKSPKLTHKL